MSVFDRTMQCNLCFAFNYGVINAHQYGKAHAVFCISLCVAIAIAFQLVTENLPYKMAPLYNIFTYHIGLHRAGSVNATSSYPNTPLDTTHTFPFTVQGMTTHPFPGCYATQQCELPVGQSASWIVHTHKIP